MLNNVNNRIIHLKTWFYFSMLIAIQQINKFRFDIKSAISSDETRYINMKNGLTYEALKFPEYVSCSDIFKTPHTHQEPILRAFNCSACLLDCSVLFESPADPL